jgi:hypothetical protein
MFFRSKKETGEVPAEAPARAPRYDCIAEVRINGFEGKAVLRNINQGGFRMESKTYVAVIEGESYSFIILPEGDSHVEPFELTVEVRWRRSTERSFNAGFRIIETPSRTFEKYLEYIKNSSASQRSHSAAADRLTPP